MDQVEVVAHPGRVAIRNRALSVEVDLTDASYRIVDRRDPAATATAARWSAADGTGRTLTARGPCAWREEALAEPFPAGRRLSVTWAGEAGVELDLHIELFAGLDAVVFGLSVANRGPDPLRVHRLEPFAGLAFPDVAAGDAWVALDGETGCVPTRVHRQGLPRCRNNLFARTGRDPWRGLVLGGLRYADFEAFAAAEPLATGVRAALWSEDPVGRLVAPGESYRPTDRWYVDLAAADPFAALERYAQAVALAQKVRLPDWGFPTVCLWWASQRGPLANDSPGAVREMDHIAASGFLRYGPVGVRLLPDSYDKNNCDGWWDDAHWARCAPTFAPPGPCYKAPWQTTAAWCTAIRERGGVPVGYLRTNGRSEDYAAAFPGHMLHDDPARRHERTVGPRWWEKDWPAAERDLVGYDFTDPAFQAHVRAVYADLKAAGLGGIFYDYPKITGWILDGGFDDPTATTARAYREIFRLAREGMGEGIDLQERAYFLGSDVAAGLATSQRVIWDNTVWAPTLLARVARRWYKNRVVMAYDTDGKDLAAELAMHGRDGLRAMLTMTCVASARMLIADSFAQLSPEILHDLSRVVPVPQAGPTARPLDVLAAGDCPRIFHLRVADDWHQLVLYNTATAAGEWPSVDVSLEPFTEGRKDYPGKVAAVTPAPGAVAVDLGAAPADGGPGLDPSRRYYVYDFWNDRLVGVFGGGERLEQALRPAEARMLAIHAVQPHPQFLSTNRHVLQGYVDLVRRPAWDARSAALRGVSRVIGGEPYQVVIATNGRTALGCSAVGAPAKIRMSDKTGGLLALLIESPHSGEVGWEVSFRKEYDQ